jgi:hypothetical protein
MGLNNSHVTSRATFLKQMNCYGFKSKFSADGSSAMFLHSDFQKGDPASCASMSRKLNRQSTVWTTSISSDLVVDEGCCALQPEEEEENFHPEITGNTPVDTTSRKKIRKRHRSSKGKIANGAPTTSEEEETKIAPSNNFEKKEKKKSKIGEHTISSSTAASLTTPIQIIQSQETALSVADVAPRKLLPLLERRMSLFQHQSIINSSEKDDGIKNNINFDEVCIRLSSLKDQPPPCPSIIKGDAIACPYYDIIDNNEAEDFDMANALLALSNNSTAQHSRW